MFGLVRLLVEQKGKKISSAAMHGLVRSRVAKKQVKSKNMFCGNIWFGALTGGTTSQTKLFPWQCLIWFAPWYRRNLVKLNKFCGNVLFFSLLGGTQTGQTKPIWQCLIGVLPSGTETGIIKTSSAVRSLMAHKQVKQN
jgi:hypothetical protein